MRRHHMKAISECPFTDQWYRLEQWSNITLFLRKTNLDCISLEQKSYQVYFSDMHYTRWRNLERRHYGRRHWRLGGDGRIKIPRPTAQCKGSVNANGRWKIRIPSRGWNSQNPWRRSTSETIHLNQGSFWTRRGIRSFSRRIRRTLFSKPSSRWLNTRWCGSKNDFWYITGDFFYRHLVEHRVKLYIPKESFPLPMKYIDVTRTTYTSLDVMLETQIEDYWNVDGER